MSTLATNRRDMLKLGALAAVPLAALAPAGALAAQAAANPAAEQAQIAALMREAVRRYNAGGVAACAGLTSCGGVLDLPGDIRALRLAGEAEPEVALADDQVTAHWSHPATAVREYAFDGDSTAERMARFQGNPAVQSESAVTLVAEMRRTADSWTIRRLHLA
ncbi:hypothetical protein [Alteraurantiacibacter palmitatis]|uniref:DUF4440 domain-containing protein n=1 Tax=Alteraurantiacibacter palmitatis TaxID=2054628 RepID=A0ABV7E4X3_9SPHN